MGISAFGAQGRLMFKKRAFNSIVRDLGLWVVGFGA